MAANLPYILRILTTVALYSLLGMGLNVTMGLAGLLDMGYVGFYALSAYTYSLLSSPQFGLHLPFYVTLPASVLAAVAGSLIVGIPTLRLHGDYLAIVTMGFAEIVRILLTNLDRPINITNGPNGIIRIDPLALGPFEVSSPIGNFILASVLAALAYAAYICLAKSRFGLKWRAMKDDPIAALSLGVNTSLYRILALATGSAFAGVAGVLFASWQGAVFPQNFTMNELIVLYCMVILGGAGNPKGTVLGAAALVIIPELLRGYSVYRMLIYGAVLVLAMIYRPRGLLPGGPPSIRLKGFNTPRTGPDDSQPAGNTVPSSTPVLSAKNLTVRFGGLTALQDVDIDLHRGEILSVIGPNGAGKTTLVNVLTGVTRPDQGTVFLNGRDVTGFRPHSLHRLGLSRTFQNNRLFSSLTAAENLMVSGGEISSLALGDTETFLSISGKPAGSLSYGHRKTLELSRALVGKPKVILLDEPAAGIGEAGIEQLTQKIRSLKSQGYSVILVEHRMPLVMGVSDRVIVLDQGHIVAEGSPAEVSRDPNVARVYFGGEAEKRALERPATTHPPAPPALEVSLLHAGYGPVKVLRGVSLSVNKGEIACLLGNNGAGKTTTLRAIMGTVRAESGSILVNARDISGTPTESLIESGVAIVPEGRRLFTRMTVGENLAAGTRPHAPKEDTSRLTEYVLSLFPILKERFYQKAGTLSGGEQQMLAIGRALMSEPALLLLDEPSMGLAPVVIERIMGVLLELRKQGVTILMAEQNARYALEICDRAYVLEEGVVALSGRPDDVAKTHLLTKAYLGDAREQS